MDKKIWIITVIIGALAIILGAFGAHALRDALTAKSLEIYKTASQYHFYHSIVLLVLGLKITFVPSYQNHILRRSFFMFLVGIICFSGSLYLLATVENEGFRQVLGPITPIGGLILILAWLNLLFLLKEKHD